MNRRALLLLPLLLAASCGRERVPIGVVVLRRPATAPITVVAAFLDRGGLTIDHADQAGLHVEAEVRVDSDRVAEFRGRELRFEDHVALDERDGKLTLRSAHDGAPDGDDWELRLTVHVSSDPAIEVKLDAGQVAVRLPASRGLSANLDAGQLDFDVDRLTGAAAVKLDAGQIRFAARDAIGDVDLEVDAGRIDLTLPGDFAGTLDAATDVGNVEVAARLGLEVERDITSQIAKGTVSPGGGTAVRLRAGAGQIIVR